MEKLKQLQAKRDELAAAIRAMAATQDNWTAEDRAKWDTLNAAYDANLAELNAEKKTLEDADKARQQIDARLQGLDTDFQPYNAPARPPLGRDNGGIAAGPRNTDQFSRDDLANPNAYRGSNLTNAMHGWLMNGSELAANITDRHRQAAAAIGASLSSPVFVINLDRDWINVKTETRQFRNSLSSQDGSQGGYTVDQTFINNLELAMLAFGGMFQTSELIRTATGEPMRWPTADDTGNTGVQVGESASHAQSTEGDSDPSFGAVIWNAYTFSSKIVKVPNELMTDSVFNFAVVLARMLGERLGRIQNTRFTVGTGAGTAKGITLCAGAGVTSGSSTAITWDEVISLEHSVDPSRRNMPGVGYMMHDNIVKLLRLLKDGEGRPIWQASANAGTPDLINNRPYQVNQDMASALASGAISMLFGELPAYKIRQVGQITLRRLDERFADTNQTGFLSLIRADGNLLDAGDHPVKKLTQV